MGDYLIISRATGDAAAADLAAMIACEGRDSGWSLTDLTPRVWIGVTGPHPPRMTGIGGWTLVGDVLDRRSPDIPASRPGDPWDYERKLVSRIWGRYAGIRTGPNQELSALLRDPSGAMECVSWTQHGLTIACSTAPDWLLRRLRPPWRINTRRLAEAFHASLAGTGRLLLDGPVALEPGTVQPLPATGPAVALWLPSDIARRSLGPCPSTQEASDRLREAVDESVAGLADLSGPLAAEVSGGLDSGIVAASLVHHRAAPVQLWINTYGVTPESDERPFAARLGAALGFDPLCVPHATAPVTLDWLEQVSPGFRPGLNALDRPHDLDWGRRMTDAGVTGLLTGRGGDSIFFQNASPIVFADLWLREGWRAIGSPGMAELAAANEVSLWTMIRETRRHARQGNRHPMRHHPLLAPLREPPPPHPWLEDSRTFGPGKAFHIAGVIDSVALHGPTARSAVVDVRNPLCAQPVVEACLALPTPLLALGGRDRGLARSAFRDRLPQEILERRSKGDMTRLYGRMILDNLDVLRPWLIGGRLADLGILDRSAAETELTPEALIWRGRYGTIMAAVALEAWVRSWEQRLGRIQESPDPSPSGQASQGSG